MIKWAIKSLSGLIIVFVVAYALQWVLWKWLWLSIPVWIICYLLHKKYGIIDKWKRFNK